MKKLCALLFLSILVTAHAGVVRLAPNFVWDGPPGANSLRAIRGQPVVLLIAKDARNGAFRAQVKKLKNLYHEFASRKVVFAAALADENGEVRSDIPFALVRNGARVAEEFEATDAFSIVLIGRDGNVDYQTDKVLPGTRVREVLMNSFVEQDERRK